MAKFNVQNKICATCEYWTGKRDIAADQKSVVVKDPKTKGFCYGKYKHQEKQANYNPSCWQQWNLLTEKHISTLLGEMQDILDE
jgi:hypothetical protein